MLRGLVEAARLSTAQLDNIAQAVMGTGLRNISNESLPAEQAADLMQYAVQYGLERKLAEAVIDAAGGHAALQFLLLVKDPEDMAQNVVGEQQVGGNGYNLLRLETKLDRVIERLDAMDRRQAAFEESTLRRQAAFEESMQRRVTALEAAPARSGPNFSTTTERVLVALLALVMASMLAYNVWRWPTP